MSIVPMLTLYLKKIQLKVLHKKNHIFRFLPVRRIAPSGMSVVDSDMFSHRLKLVTGDINSVLTPLSKDKNDILSLADSTFDSLRILGVDVPGGHLDWSRDYRSSFQWPHAFYLYQRSISDGTCADIKFPWELSRCHHLLWLSEAYLVTEEHKYSDVVLSTILDWIRSNPLLFSVNWCCPMDVAIRAVNWIYALSMISESKSFKEMDSEDLRLIYKSLYQHGWFIYHNLEIRYPYRHNHYFSNVVGLLFLGKLFDTTSYGRRWLKFAEKEFYKELRIQTLPSGVNYEFSISYHRLMTEFCSYTIHLLSRVGRNIPEDVLKRTEAMLEYVSVYIKANGFAPQVGDNDDGRFLPFLKRDFRDHSYLIDPKGLENQIVSVGSSVINMPKYKARGAFIFPDAGHCVMKQGDIYMSIVNRGSGCNVNDTGDCYVGGHTHNDKLSFEMSLGKTDVFVDPGTYLYTSDIQAHNEFRSTKKHNTAEVDEEEQNILSSSSAFSYLPNSKVERLVLNKEKKCISGSYLTFKGEMSHSRTFWPGNGRVDIIDSFRKVGEEHSFQMFFHLAPKAKSVKASSNCFNIRVDEYEVIVSFESDVKKLDSWIEEDTYSPSYGALERSACIRVSGTFAGEAGISTKMIINRLNQ